MFGILRHSAALLKKYTFYWFLNYLLHTVYLTFQAAAALYVENNKQISVVLNIYITEYSRNIFLQCVCVWGFLHKFAYDGPYAILPALFAVSL